MQNKLKKDEILMISKEELQRLYRTIREYQDRVEQLQQENQQYLRMLTQAKVS